MTPSRSLAHQHHHEHGAPPPAALTASVAIDVGAGRGALVLYPGERHRGTEIEISRADGGGGRVHTGVHERTTASRATLTAVFGSLPAGEYVIWADRDVPGPVVTVPDGAVAELRVA
jgi:hypothetical protein